MASRSNTWIHYRGLFSLRTRDEVQTVLLNKADTRLVTTILELSIWRDYIRAQHAASQQNSNTPSPKSAQIVKAMIENTAEIAASYPFFAELTSADMWARGVYGLEQWALNATKEDGSVQFPAVSAKPAGKRREVFIALARFLMSDMGRKTTKSVQFLKEELEPRMAQYMLEHDWQLENYTPPGKTRQAEIISAEDSDGRIIKAHPLEVSWVNHPVDAEPNKINPSHTSLGKFDELTAWIKEEWQLSEIQPIVKIHHVLEAGKGVVAVKDDGTWTKTKTQNTESTVLRFWIGAAAQDSGDEPRREQQDRPSSRQGEPSDHDYDSSEEVKPTPQAPAFFKRSDKTTLSLMHVVKDMVAKGEWAVPKGKTAEKSADNIADLNAESLDTRNDDIGVGQPAAVSMSHESMQALLNNESLQFHQDVDTAHTEIAKLLRLSPDDENTIVYRLPNKRTLKNGLPEKGETHMGHQAVFLHWALTQEQSPIRGGICADACGMGKTHEIMSLIIAGQITGKINREKPLPTLLVVPANLEPKWYDDLYGGLGTAFKITRMSGIGQKLKTRIDSGDEVYKMKDPSAVVILATYDVIGGMTFADRSHLVSRIILDEAQHIRHLNDTLRGKNLVAIQAQYRWSFTATLIYNTVHDILGFLQFHSRPEFEVDLTTTDPSLVDYLNRINKEHQPGDQALSDDEDYFGDGSDNEEVNSSEGHADEANDVAEHHSTSDQTHSWDVRTDDNNWRETCDSDDEVHFFATWFDQDLQASVVDSITVVEVPFPLDESEMYLYVYTWLVCISDELNVSPSKTLSL